MAAPRWSIALIAGAFMSMAAARPQRAATACSSSLLVGLIPKIAAPQDVTVQTSWRTSGDHSIIRSPVSTLKVEFSR